MKIKSLKQNVAIDFISSDCNAKAHPDPSSAGTQSFKQPLELMRAEMLVFGRRDPSTGETPLCRISALGSELLLLNLTDILSLVSGQSGLSYRSKSMMAVNDEAMQLVVSLVPLHLGIIEVCPAGVGQPCGNTPGCTEEAQAVNSVLPFSS